jgi:hypothetical protein
MRTIATGDSQATALIPVTLLTGHGVRMDDFKKYFVEQGVDPYYFKNTPHGVLPSYPLMAGVLAVPFYIAPMISFLSTTPHPTIAQWIQFSIGAEKVAASFMTALAAAVFFLVCIRLKAGRATAYLLTAACAFGTEAWSTSSQALWQHGPSTLFLLLAIFVMLIMETRTTSRTAIFFGIACGIALAIRPLNIFIVAFLYLCFALKQHRFIIQAAVPVLVILFTVAAYNALVLGDARGFYTQSFDSSMIAGLAGLLFSPGRGLFFYFPLALYGLIGITSAYMRHDEHRTLYAALVVGAFATVLVLSKWYSWWGGWSYGPRLLTETQPLFLLAAIPILSKTDRPRIVRAIFIVLFTWSVFVQFVGAFVYPTGRWNYQPAGLEQNKSRLWEWGDNPVFRDLSTVINRSRLKPKSLE